MFNLQDATPVTDPAARSGDLEYFIEDSDGIVDLTACQWYEVAVPMTAWDALLALDTPLVYAGTIAEQARNASILAWVAECGGWDNALRISPPIAAITANGQVEFIDGWHRLALAKHAGVQAVCSLIGVTP